MPLDLHEATSRRRAGMVDRLAAEGVLTDSLLRDALLCLPREVLLPHAYVRVSGPGADPIDWRLLDGSHPDDRLEWLDVIHSDESILLQRDGEPLDALPRGPVTGGHMTSMSTYTPATIEALQAMNSAPGSGIWSSGRAPASPSHSPPPSPAPDSPPAWSGTGTWRPSPSGTWTVSASVRR